MCALVTTQGNPVPPGGTCRMVRTADGTSVRVAHWPAAAQARGTVVLLNGHTEFIEKYFEVIGELTGRGFAVATLDWRGQGLSDRPLNDPLKSHVTDFAEFGQDLSALLDEVVRPECPKPCILMGHSLGGHLGMRALRDHPDLFDRAVLCAPFTSLRAGETMRTVLRGLSALARMTGRADRRFPFRPARTPLDIPFADNEVTRDQGRFERMQDILRAEPRLLLNGITWGWLGAAIRSQDETHGPHFMPTIRVPILLISAENEKLVSNRDHVRLAAVWSNVRRVVMEDAWHEVLMERDRIRERFWAEFDGFTEAIRQGNGP